MPLNIKNAEVERLVEEVAKATGESKTEAIRKALLERKARLAVIKSPTRRRMEFLVNEVWPAVPAKQRGKRLTRREEDAILGFGREGV